MATGCFFCFAIPSAKKAADRSSIITHVFTASCSVNVIASGVDLEPGEITTSVKPFLTSSSTKFAVWRDYISICSIIILLEKRITLVKILYSFPRILLLHESPSRRHILRTRILHHLGSDRNVWQLQIHRFDCCQAPL